MQGVASNGNGAAPRVRPRVLMRCLAKMTGLAAAIAMAVSPGFAQPAPQRQQKPPTIIRDAEIEQLLREYAAPVMRVAGINAHATKIVLLGDRAFNAFIVDGKRIFLNIGALMESETPNQVIGVLAHETGHIAGGHLARLRQELRSAQIIAIAGMLLGAAAIAASARPNSPVGISGNTPAGLLLSGPEIAMRSLLAYQRGEEAAADRAAVTYLDKTGQGTQGMIETFQRFNQQRIFASANIDRYTISHPLPQERVAALDSVARASPNFGKKDSPAMQARHDMMRAKLFGFAAGQDEVLRRYPASDTSLAARYARAISAYRFRRIDAAQAQIDSLIRERPGNPWFWELKGQALLENGRANEALAPLRKAVALSGGHPLLRMLLGHALVSTDTARNADEALKHLQVAMLRDPDAADGWQYLARAYARKGNEPMAALASAQGYFADGAYDEARRLARRAKAGLPENSPGWRQADDIFNHIPDKKS